MTLKNIINDSVVTSCFSETYPFINKYVIENGDSVESRNGDTREIIDFKTTLTNPYKRCVGNNSRDINIFFLLAEAIWIFRGEKDVEFLDIFNSNMKNYSDDGKTFHAPYGFRLRHHGVSSFDRTLPTSPENNGHAVEQSNNGVDQILQTLKDLHKDSETRRAVMQIWNADLDLGTSSKDLPCNDMVFIKIRNGKLRTTISNRSNDLHWGLPTNVFQFSFLTEIMSNILGLELGTQTHNSQSLHIYNDNEIAWKMYDEIQLTNGNFEDLYSVFVPGKMDMCFDAESIEGRLSEVDYFLSMIIDSIKNNKRITETEEQTLCKFSKYLHLVYDLLMLYVDYKGTERKDTDKWKTIDKLTILSNFYPSLDIIALSVNFFATKVKDKEIVSVNLTSPIGKM
jgi:thymidylate synthase